MKGAELVKCEPSSVPVIRRKLDRNETMVRGVERNKVDQY
jgi:hypothetical protein